MKKRGSNFSITFEWNSLIKDFIRNFWAVILAAVIAWMGIKVFETSVYTPTYTSGAVLVVRSKSGTNGVYSNLSASSEMAVIYSEVFKQPSLKKLAAENLGYSSFDGTITAEVRGSTNIMNISVKSNDPKTAFMLLKSVLEVYPKVSEFVFTDAVIDVLSAPKMPMAPSNSVLTRYRNHIVLAAMVFVAGLIVIPACFIYDIPRQEGPSLIFEALPNVFNAMPGGQVWGSLFFLFMVFAAISTVIAVFENIIAFPMDKWNWSRKKACLVNFIAVTILSLPCALGFNLLSDITPFGEDSTILSLEDFIISNNILPLGSLVYVLFCTRSKYGWGWKNFIQEANTGKGINFPEKIRIYASYILPIVLIVIWVQCYLSKFFPYAIPNFINIIKNIFA